MIEYSAHAQEKMQARRIPASLVERALVEGLREPSFKDRQIVRARLEGFELTVVIIEEQDRTVVITTYRNPPWEEETP